MLLNTCHDVEQASEERWCRIILSGTSHNCIWAEQKLMYMKIKQLMQSCGRSSKLTLDYIIHCTTLALLCSRTIDLFDSHLASNNNPVSTLCSILRRALMCSLHNSKHWQSHPQLAASCWSRSMVDSRQACASGAEAPLLFLDFAGLIFEV